MKINVLSFVIFISCISCAQNITIVSPWLKANILATNTTDYLTAKDLNGNWLQIDQNSDGEIQIEEALNVSYYFDANLGAVTSFEGLNSFANLEYLTLAYNQVPTDLDLSGLDKLKYLFCYYNSLTGVNLEGCVSLETINLNLNYVTSLDVSELQALQILNCQNNYLTTLDISACSALNSLSCYNNSLSNLNINNGVNWIPFDGTSGNFIGFGNTSISQVCTNLASVPLIADYYSPYTSNVTDCTTLDSKESMVSEVKFYPNPAKDKIFFTEQMDEVAIYYFQKKLIVSKNSNELDLSELASGIYIVKMLVRGATIYSKLIKE
ncbi:MULTISPECIES: T9SS type A sorting domain-containing protein [unclassified Flavobacterium]|uniref:T9SS type A sorting domain-containing protein n=1 Tax=unclassified Flavobacterium TaxID=196869 RepID=UPI001F1488DF|nr:MULTISPECIES: T9SS type A sorting domain-containing protein [unclassified Flavobacterium]UMY65110.1 T9SS type A sorting domain-containing protein [Flavobacterium sp. HJ-32-4]